MTVEELQEKQALVKKLKSELKNEEMALVLLKKLKQSQTAAAREVGQVVQGGHLSVPHQSPGQTVRGRLELLVRLLLQVRLPLLHVREPGQGQHWAGEGHQNLPGREDGGLSREGFQVDNLKRRESE